MKQLFFYAIDGTAVALYHSTTNNNQQYTNERPTASGA